MIKINLTPFTLPQVNKLLVQSQGEPFRHEVAPNTFMPFRNIYYEIRDINDVLRESGTQSIPESIYTLCGSFVMGDVSEQTLTTLNAFFKQAGLINMVAINPPEQ